MQDGSKSKGLTLWLSILFLATLACQAINGASETPNAAATAVQQTLQAEQGGNADPGGLQPISPADLTATSNAAAAVANQTPAGSPATATVPQTNAQAPTAAPLTATTTPCDKVSFIKDITVSDNTKMKPGSTFTKTWRLQNVGSCPWTSGYKIVFDHGDAMGGPKDVQLTTGSVAPGQTIDVSVNLTAPASPGTYQGFWKLRNPAGVLFGWGDKADSAFWVKIDVEAAAQQPPANTKKQVTLAATSNGGSVDSNGLSNPNYIPGDDTSDLAWTTFIDFPIVDIPSTATIHSAILDLPCIWVAGDPFNELDELGVFYSYYGDFDPLVLAQKNYDLSNYLGSLISCPDTPLDVTASLQAHLGPPYYQVIALFKYDTDSKADDDFIQITTPILKVEYTP
jgi:hypothetical protein